MKDKFKDTTIDTVGKCANCGVEFHIHKPPVSERPEIVVYCGSLRKATEAFKKAEYEATMRGEIALLPCCMFVDIEREYGAQSDYKAKADAIHKSKIDICDRVVVLNVGGYIGESTRNEINYAIEIDKRVSYLEAIF